MVRPRLILLLIILVGMGVIITYCSVFLPPTTAMINPGGSGSSEYGFPSPWKVNNVLYCSPLHPQACPTPIYSSDYDWIGVGRSEEHTSELQSLRHLVCRLLLEKKKKK